MEMRDGKLRLASMLRRSQAIASGSSPCQNLATPANIIHRWAKESRGERRNATRSEIFGAVHLGIPAQQLPERPAQLVESYYGPS